MSTVQVLVFIMISNKKFGRPTDSDLDLDSLLIGVNAEQVHKNCLQDGKTSFNCIRIKHSRACLAH